MSFEIDLLVVNQAKPIPIPFLSSMEVINEVDDETVLRFDSTWKVMSQTKGIWYSVVKEDDGVKNAYLLCTSDFEKETENSLIPFWA